MEGSFNESFLRALEEILPNYYQGCHIREVAESILNDFVRKILINGRPRKGLSVKTSILENNFHCRIFKELKGEEELIEGKLEDLWEELLKKAPFHFYIQEAQKKIYSKY